MSASLALNRNLTPAPACLAGRPGPTVRKTFVLNNRQGLHCRPALLLIKTLEEFRCRATVQSNGATANARSVFELMCLAAGHGTKLTFVVTGPEAQEAMTAVQQLFDSNFVEAYSDGEGSEELRVIP